MIRGISVFFILFVALLNAQSVHTYIARSDTFNVNLKGIYEISAPVIIPGSESLLIRGKQIERKYYSFNYSEGTFSLSDSLNYSLNDTLIIKYLTVRISLKRKYKKRELVKVFAPSRKDTLRRIKPLKSSFTEDEIFGGDMRKSGTIVRGFTLGTNRDMTINSGLRLQLSGKLTEDIDIVAALTDENTPIQPEGNSERLEELDKVFIQIKHPAAEGIFGDFDLKSSSGIFSNIKRKLQGLKAEINYSNQRAMAAFASARGKFTTNKIAGADGVQGPYRLTGANGERDIIIIAGSERVYIDGIEMKRGENNDYVIEYANSELTFTPERLVTSASRITVDFEYTDRRYQRNFFGAAASSKLFGDKLNISANYYNESDDQNSPIDLILNDNDKSILASSGDDRSKAVRSGVSLSQPDSNGVVRGTYAKVDTVINGANFSFYEYLPGDPRSIYNVIFSYVGIGKGDYKKISSGNFIFSGIGAGEYLPLYFLPMPEKKETASIIIESEPLKNLNLSVELAGSNWDKNRFSGIGNDDNFGYASNLRVEFKQSDVSLGGTSFGKAGFYFRNRFIENRFTSIDRINSIEFNRDYNISGTLGADEKLTEAGINYSPVSQFNVNANYGSLKKGNILSSDRFFSDIDLNIEGLTKNKFNIDFVKSDNANISTDWMKQEGTSELSIWKFSPGLYYFYERRRDKLTSDSLLSSSLKYFELAPFLKLMNWGGLSLTAKYSYREESFPLLGKLEIESRAISNILSISYSTGSAFRSKLDLTLRDKKFEAKFKRNGKLNNQTLLVRSDTRLNLLKKFFSGEIYYQTATERTSRLERVFVRVPAGMGSYIYLGDLNNNGVADENEFQQSLYEADYIITNIPTDELFPVITLKTNFRWKFNFKKIIKGTSFFKKALRAVSTESVIRIDEKSKEEDLKKIYLMTGGSLLNDSTTLNGSQFMRHDFYLFKTNREISFRYRFEQRKSLNQYSSGLSRNYYRLNGVRLKFRMIAEINNQTDFNFITDNNISPSSVGRSRTVNTQEVISDFSYRPYRNIEVGMRFSVSRSKDLFPSVPSVIDINSQTLRLTFSFLRKGRLRTEIERSEIGLNNQNNSVPFEITKGSAVGKNYLLRINFEYRIGANLQTTVGYLGRKQGAGRIIHSLRAEARAYF